MEEKERTKIEKGFRVGRLVVDSDTGQRKNGYTIWHCVCDCGGTIALDTRTLQRRTVLDCGCMSKVKPGQKDIQGQRFGRLVAIEPTQERSSGGATVWKCKCDCGKECLAVSTQLTQGNKKSCGCMSHPPIKDYTGKRFGRLTVKGYFGKSDGMHRWECLCDCGNTTIVGQTQLQSGKTKSCGCLRAKSVAENMKFVDGTSVTLLEKAGSRLVSTNTSGYNGVYFSKKARKWRAQIGFMGNNFYLGSFSNVDEAVKARKEAEKHIYADFLEWYYEAYAHRFAQKECHAEEGR